MTPAPPSIARSTAGLFDVLVAPQVRPCSLLWTLRSRLNRLYLLKRLCDRHHQEWGISIRHRPDVWLAARRILWDAVQQSRGVRWKNKHYVRSDVVPILSERRFLGTRVVEIRCRFPSEHVRD